MENIKVITRFRPLNEKEIKNNEENPWKINANNVIQSNELTDSLPMQKINSYGSNIRLSSTSTTKSKQSNTFAFDAVFDETKSNDYIYNKAAKKMILDCQEGYNGTIFMYGQTGSGKTYTMMGYNDKQSMNIAKFLEKEQNAGQPKKFDNLSNSDELFSAIDNMSIGSESLEFKIDLGINDIQKKCPDLLYKYAKGNLTKNTGVLIQSLKDIFDKIETDLNKTYFLKASYFEIYNDNIYDLLTTQDKQGNTLNMAQDTKKDSFVIKNLTEKVVTSVEETLQLLKRGEINRHYAATMMNHSSSRSHTVFRITVKAVTNDYVKCHKYKQSQIINSENEDLLEELSNKSMNEEVLQSDKKFSVVTESYINFVDLAGSEKVSNHFMNQSPAKDDQDFCALESVLEEESQKKCYDKSERVKEGKHINKSLFFLTHVISLKARGKSNEHIPFRNSPLTKILKCSLGGNFRTLVVLCCNPSDKQTEITMSTLRFGTNAKKIQNNVKANIITKNNEKAMKLLIENYEKKILDLKNTQQNDDSKFYQYKSIIEELRLQRMGLLERIKAANRDKVINIANAIPENELNQFFKAAKKRNLYLDYPGILMIPDKLKKYDDMDLNEDTHNLNDSFAIKKKTLEKKFNREMKETNTNEIIHMHALQSYADTKSEQNQLKNTVHNQKIFIENMCTILQKVCSFVTHLSELGQTYLMRLINITEQYQDEYVLGHEKTIKLDFYEKSKGLCNCSDDDLIKLNNYFDEFKAALKGESDRRMLLKCIKNDKITMPEEAVRSLNAAEKDEEFYFKTKMELFKDQVEKFAKFKGGIEGEIKYYTKVIEDFQKQTELQNKVRDIQDILDHDFEATSQKFQKMDSKFKELDKTIENSTQIKLNEKLEEYKNKFEKLVDVVLNEKKMKEVENNTKENIFEGPSNITAFKRLRLNTFGAKSTVFTEEDRLVDNHIVKKVRKNKQKDWLDIKELESQEIGSKSILNMDTHKSNLIFKTITRDDSPDEENLIKRSIQGSKSNKNESGNALHQIPVRFNSNIPEPSVKNPRKDTRSRTQLSYNFPFKSAINTTNKDQNLLSENIKKEQVQKANDPPVRQIREDSSSFYEDHLKHSNTYRPTNRSEIKKSENEKKRWHRKDNNSKTMDPSNNDVLIKNISKQNDENPLRNNKSIDSRCSVLSEEISPDEKEIFKKNNKLPQNLNKHNNETKSLSSRNKATRHVDIKTTFINHKYTPIKTDRVSNRASHQLLAKRSGGKKNTEATNKSDLKALLEIEKNMSKADTLKMIEKRNTFTTRNDRSNRDLIGITKSTQFDTTKKVSPNLHTTKKTLGKNIFTSEIVTNVNEAIENKTNAENDHLIRKMKSAEPSNIFIKNSEKEMLTIEEKLLSQQNRSLSPDHYMFPSGIVNTQMNSSADNNLQLRSTPNIINNMLPKSNESLTKKISNELVNSLLDKNTKTTTDTPKANTLTQKNQIIKTVPRKSSIEKNFFNNKLKNSSGSEQNNPDTNNMIYNHNAHTTTLIEMLLKESNANQKISEKLDSSNFENKIIDEEQESKTPESPIIFSMRQDIQNSVLFDDFVNRINSGSPDQEKNSRKKSSINNKDNACNSDDNFLDEPSANTYVTPRPTIMKNNKKKSITEVKPPTSIEISSTARKFPEGNLNYSSNDGKTLTSLKYRKEHTSLRKTHLERYSSKNLASDLLTKIFKKR